MLAAAHADLLCRPELDRYVGGPYDLFKRHRPNISEHKLVTLAKSPPLWEPSWLSSLRVVWHYTTIFEGINKLISYVAPRSRLCFC